MDGAGSLRKPKVHIWMLSCLAGKQAVVQSHVPCSAQMSLAYCSEVHLMNSLILQQDSRFTQAEVKHWLSCNYADSAHSSAHRRRMTEWF